MPALNEKRLRKSGFRDGVRVTMADGQDWTLPLPRLVFVADPSSEDGIGTTWDISPEYGAMLDDAAKASGRAFIAAEMRVFKFLLEENYRLRPEDFGKLLRLDYGGSGEVRSRFKKLRDDLASIAMGERPSDPKPGTTEGRED